MKKLFDILFLFSAVFSYAQVTIGVQTNKKDYSENDDVVVNVLLEIAGQDMVQGTPLRMFDTSKFDVIATGSDQNTFIDQKTGFKVNQTVYQMVLRPKKAGKFKIGSASVVVNDKLYYTEPFDIFVAASDKKIIADNSYNDVFLNVELKDSEVFENQPTVAILRAYSKNFDNFRKVKNIKFPHQENVNIRPVSYQKSEIEPSGNMASQVLAVFLIFPKESGKVEVAPVSANLSTADTRIVSNKVKLNVKSLPKNSPSDYQNAVGNFKVNIVNKHSEKVEVEKPIRVTVKISGEGNFGSMNLPKLAKSDDYVFYEPKVTKNTVSDETGIKGEIVSDYVVIPKKPGPIKIRTEKFAYFNPGTQKYVDLGAETLALNAFTTEQIRSARTPLERVNDYTNIVLETVDNPVIQTKDLKVAKKSSVNWNAVWINAGLLSLALFGFIFFRNYQKKAALHKNLSNQNEKKPVGSVQETEEEIRESLKSDVQDYFNYLKVLKDEGNYSKFFDTVSELDHEVRNQYFQNTEADFRVFLEKHKGQLLAEQYRNLSQQIQIEKYAPVHSSEQMDALLESVVNLYSQISK